MTQLLRLDASARQEGSHSRNLADYFQQKWQAAHPKGRVIDRDLAADPIPHLKQEVIEAFFSTEKVDASVTRLSDKLIAELKASDHILISTPLYNFTLPSTLKSYIDTIVRINHTYEIIDGQYLGMCHGKSATIITAMGATIGQVPDFQADYLKYLLGFIGITDVAIVTQDGTAYGEESKTTCKEAAEAEIDWLFSRHREAKWIGDFSMEDKLEISRLRDGQAKAIVNKEEEAYAALCMDDIHLMVPNLDVLQDINQFKVAEHQLFKSVTFSFFDKHPISVERQGNLAIEIGRQNILMQPVDSKHPLESLQKYLHIYRLTESGWRFQVLMSNTRNEP